MSKYEIIRMNDEECIIRNTETGKYFDGYDSMGGDCWTPSIASCSRFELNDAIQVTKDLKSADEPAEPMKKTNCIEIGTCTAGAIVGWLKDYAKIAKQEDRLSESDIERIEKITSWLYEKGEEIDRRN